MIFHWYPPKTHPLHNVHVHVRVALKMYLWALAKKMQTNDAFPTGSYVLQDAVGVICITPGSLKFPAGRESRANVPKSFYMKAANREPTTASPNPPETRVVVAAPVATWNEEDVVAEPDERAAARVLEEALAKTVLLEAAEVGTATREVDCV